MEKRIVVDPITRIEGHLRVEIEVGHDWQSEAHSCSDPHQD